MHPDELIGVWSCGESGYELKINPDGEFFFTDQHENEENPGSWFVIDDELHFIDENDVTGKYYFSIENINEEDNLIMELEAIDDLNDFRREFFVEPLVKSELVI